MHIEILKVGRKFKVMTDGLCYETCSSRAAAEETLTELKRAAEITEAVDNAVLSLIDEMAARFDLLPAQVLPYIRRACT
jgi:hypothetical protein